MPIEEIVDELVEVVDYDISSVAEELKEITYALMAGDEKRALKLAKGALALLSPPSEGDSSGDESNFEIEDKSGLDMEGAFHSNMMRVSRLWTSSMLCGLFTWGFVPWFWQRAYASTFWGVAANQY